MRRVLLVIASILVIACSGRVPLGDGDNPALRSTVFWDGEVSGIRVVVSSDGTEDCIAIKGEQPAGDQVDGWSYGCNDSGIGMKIVEVRPHEWIAGVWCRDGGIETFRMRTADGREEVVTPEEDRFVIHWMQGDLAGVQVDGACSMEAWPPF